VKLDPDIVKVKFLVNKFDKEIFGSRQFKIIFHEKGAVYLSGGDLMELTDSRNELNLFFEPYEREEVEKDRSTIKIVRSSQQGSFTSRSEFLEEEKREASPGDRYSPTSSNKS